MGFESKETIQKVIKNMSPASRWNPRTKCFIEWDWYIKNDMSLFVFVRYIRRSKGQNVCSGASVALIVPIGTAKAIDAIAIVYFNWILIQFEVTFNANYSDWLCVSAAHIPNAPSSTWSDTQSSVHTIFFSPSLSSSSSPCTFLRSASNTFSDVNNEHREC